MALQLPLEFENNMKTRLAGEFPRFVDALNQPATISVRYHPEKSKIQEGDPVGWCRTGRYLKERPVFTLDPVLHAGGYYVQEASSMFLEQGMLHAIGAGKSINALDLCAAPGGKSTHLAGLLSKESLLVSNEVIRSRAGILSENMQKWGKENVIITNNDPADFENLPSFFDLVVVDAPCSGEGLFRKDPDAIQEWSEKNLELCTLRQRRIVADVWTALKPGGVLIYSTCTYNENENISNLKWINEQYPVDFIKIPVRNEWNIGVQEDGDIIGYQFYPHLTRGEGFFMSVMRKKEGPVSHLRLRETLRSPAKSQVKDISSWILHPDSHCYFLHNETIRIISDRRKYELQAVLNRLNVVNAGTALAEITKNKYVPDHALALSIELNKTNFNTISLSKPEALEYLRKNQFDLKLEKTGFSLIDFEGLPLGWVNIMPNRYNNLYPAGWRIRMGPEAPL